MGVYSAPGAAQRHLLLGSARAPPAGISIVSQSGAYGGLIFRHLGGRGLGVARFLSIGNQADVDIAEVLDFLVDDPATTLVACFVEALRDGRRFVAAADAGDGAQADRPAKGGRSDAGRRAAGSHTGLAGRRIRRLSRGVPARGVVLAEETEEFFDAIETLGGGPARRPARPRHRRPHRVRRAVGGRRRHRRARGARRCRRSAERRAAALRALLPPFAAVGNPVDLTPQVEPARIAAADRRVLRRAGRSAGVVAVNVGLDFPEFADARRGRRAGDRTSRPSRSPRMRRGSPRACAPAGCPCCRAPSAPCERGARSGRRARRRRPAVRGAAARRPGGRALATARGAAAVRARPGACSRRVASASVARRSPASADEAVAAAERIGYPGRREGRQQRAHAQDRGRAASYSTSGDAAAVRAACADAGRRGADAVRRPGAGGAGRRAAAGRAPRRGRSDRWSSSAPAACWPRCCATSRCAWHHSARVRRRRCWPRARARACWRGRAACGPVEPARWCGRIEAVGGLIAAEPRIVEIDVNPLIAAGADVVAVDALVIVDGCGRRRAASR